jgi:NADH-quinone oxidoreductase subunit K
MTLAFVAGTEWYLGLSAIVFSIGTVGLLVRRNPLVMFMCVELMLNAVNITFVALSHEFNDVGGQLAVFFVLVVAAAEVVAGLAIIVAIMRRRPNATADDISVLKG